MYQTPIHKCDRYVQRINKNVQDTRQKFLKSSDNKGKNLYKLKATIRLDRFNYFESNMWNDDNPNKEFILGSLTENCWTNRSLENRKKWNETMKRQESRVLSHNTAMWMYYDGDFNDSVLFEKCELQLSLQHPPIIRFTLTYGQTSLSIVELEEMIGGIFDHWQNAGDESFVICDLKWKRL
jgi:hypothetical protein